MRSARLAKVQHAGVARSEQVWSVMLGSAPSRGCIATGKVRDQQAWPLVSCVLVWPSWVAKSNARRCSVFYTYSKVAVHVPRARGPTGGTCRLAVVVVDGGGGRGPTPLRYHPRKSGVDSMGSDATLQTVGEVRARLQNSKVHKPNDAICEVTGRRHRESSCRSVYSATPWWLLTVTSEDVGEKQLYCSQSRDGIWRCGALALLIS